MGKEININSNYGIISTGNNSNNSYITIDNSQKADDIRWDFLMKEIEALKSSPDSSIKKFSAEAKEAAENKDKKAIFKIFVKWLPCIGKLIESSYYIIEIAKRFNINIG